MHDKNNPQAKAAYVALLRYRSDTNTKIVKTRDFTVIESHVKEILKHLGVPETAHNENLIQQSAADEIEFGDLSSDFDEYFNDTDRTLTPQFFEYLKTLTQKRNINDTYGIAAMACALKNVPTSHENVQKLIGWLKRMGQNLAV